MVEEGSVWNDVNLGYFRHHSVINVITAKSALGSFSFATFVKQGQDSSVCGV